MIGNAVKAGVRFTTYDQFKSLLKDKDVSYWLNPPDCPLSTRSNALPLPSMSGQGSQKIHADATLLTPQGKLSAPRSMLAGLGAGMMEAIIAVTPSETIK